MRRSALALGFLYVLGGTGWGASDGPSAPADSVAFWFAAALDASDTELRWPGETAAMSAYRSFVSAADLLSRNHRFGLRGYVLTDADLNRALLHLHLAADRQPDFAHRPVL